MRTIILATLVLAIAGLAVIVVLNRPVKQRTVSGVAAVPAVEPAQPASSSVAPAETVPPVAGVREAPLPPSPAPNAPSLAEQLKRAVKPSSAGGANPRAGRTAKQPLQDPLARDALALVGLDPSAEEYWGAAINDPSLSAHERKDLIEDLNEDGLPDPKHPTPEDLPVILNRIRLIEALGPYAMDQDNADAFKEAYKDLVNLAELAMGSGEPVK